MSSHDEDGRKTSRSAADLEGALEHAERMLTSFDRTNRELRTLRAIGTCITAAAILVAALIFALSPGGLNTVAGIIGAILALAMVVAAMGALALLGSTVSATRRQLERDLSGLVQLSRVVRDLMPVVAKNEQWSELRYLTMRARIARFPISEESR